MMIYIILFLVFACLLAAGYIWLKRKFTFIVNGWGVCFANNKLIPWSAIQSIDRDVRHFINFPFLRNMNWAILSLKSGETYWLILDHQENEPDVMWASLVRTFQTHGPRRFHMSQKLFGK